MNGNLFEWFQTSKNSSSLVISIWGFFIFVFLLFVNTLNAKYQNIFFLDLLIQVIYKCIILKITQEQFFKSFFLVYSQNLYHNDMLSKLK